MISPPWVPGDLLAEKAAELRRPFSPNLVLFRAEPEADGTYGDTAEVVPYINRGLVIDRLNVVVPGLWSASYDPQTGKDTALMWCHLTIDGVTRSDVGDARTGNGKALVSDSLKRAAMHFGVGISLAAMPRVEFNIGTTERFHLKRLGPRRVALTDAGRAACERHYETWLTNVGNAAYGEPLQHGAPDQRRPLKGDSHFDTAAQWESTQPAVDPELERESLIHRAGELSAQLDIEPPVLAPSITVSEIKAMVNTLEVAIAAAEREIPAEAA